MLISDILKNYGLFSTDIKNRMKNGQILLNGEYIKNDIDINVDKNIVIAGNFVFNLLKYNPEFYTVLKIVGFENLFECNIQHKIMESINKYHLLKISKKELILLKKYETASFIVVE